MRRPAGRLVAGYAAGLLLAAMLQPSLRLSLLMVAVVGLGGLMFAKIRRWGFLVFLAAIGMANLSWRTLPTASNDLRLVLGTNQAIVTVRGSLRETPREKINVSAGFNSERTLAQVTASQIRWDDQWQDVTGTIMVTTPGILAANFCAGQAVEVTGVIDEPPAPVAEGLFNYREYLATRGIYYELKTRGTNDWSRRDPLRATLPWSDRFLRWSRRTMAYGMPVEDEPLQLLWAMTLDWRTTFTNDISEPFLRAGTMHLFAIDGLRIALVAGIVITLLRALGCSRTWAGAVIIPLIWFYTAATGWEASAIRASIMMTIIIGGWALERPSDLLNSLAVSGLIILLGDPRQLFEAGFQLSFLVVLVIGVMLPPLQRWIDERVQYDPLLPTQLLTLWQVRRRSWARALAHFAGLSLTAWVASIPLAAKYFHLFSPVSTLANILAVPLGTLALTANLGSLICGSWFPWATVCFNHAAWLFMSEMTWVSQICTELPGAYLYVPEPCWWAITIYYLVIILLFSGWLNSRARWCWFLVLGAATLVMPGWRLAQAAVETKITVLPLNGGQAVVVDGPGRTHDWIFDCGNAQAEEFTLKPFLQGQGFNRLPRLVLTEGQQRHYAGALALDKAFGIEQLWTSRVRFRSGNYRETVRAFEGPPDRHCYFEVGTNYGGWQMLHPRPEPLFPRADDAAMVLRGEVLGTKLLLLSDLGRSGQSALLATTNGLAADIVISGLPERDEPLVDDLIQAIRPKLIIIADSDFPPERRANATFRERLEQQGVPVIFTRDSGAVTILVNRQGWKIRTMNNAGDDSPMGKIQ